MAPLQRLPCPALSPFVALLWADDHDPLAPPSGVAIDGVVGPASATPVAREHVLPTGLAHLVFRSPASPAVTVLRCAGDLCGHTLPRAVVGGARSTFYVRAAPRAQRSAGALLRPGAARWLLGVPAHALAEQHTALGDLWGAGAGEVHEELLSIADPAARLAQLERLLLVRLRAGQGPMHAPHPAVAAALRAMSHSGPQGHAQVQAWVEASGLSHRHFIALFREATGLPPKAFARVQRFRRALRAAAVPGAALALVALDAGYSDQAHCSRDATALAGLPPLACLRRAPGGGSHVPVA